jgi:hypothetical protein
MASGTRSAKIQWPENVLLFLEKVVAPNGSISQTFLCKPFSWEPPLFAEIPFICETPFARGEPFCLCGAAPFLAAALLDGALSQRVNER